MNETLNEFEQAFYPTKEKIAITVGLTSALFILTFFLGGLDFPFSMVKWVEPSDPFYLGQDYGGLKFANIAINLISVYVLTSFSSKVYREINEGDSE